MAMSHKADGEQAVVEAAAGRSEGNFSALPWCLVASVPDTIMTVMVLSIDRRFHHVAQCFQMLFVPAMCLCLQTLKTENSKAAPSEFNLILVPSAKCAAQSVS